MTIIEAIRTFFRSQNGKAVHVQDLYAHLPEEHEHSVRARIYERLGTEFKRVGHGLYVAVDGPAACVVVEGDAWEELKRLPPDFADALVTDPPYPWLDDHIGHGTTRPRMRWDFERKEIDQALAFEFHRVLKPGAHAFIFVPALTGTTEPHVSRLREILTNAGFVFQKQWIWDKIHAGMGYSGRARHEGILFLTKGKKRQPCDRSIPDVLGVPAIHHTKRKHPTEKPQKLLEAIIKFATQTGELVLDCFAGSLSTGRAALALGRHGLMIEKNPELLQNGLA